MNHVRFEGVSVEYDSRSVVSDVTFDVSEGTWVAVVGPNGAGKTTLLKTLVGSLSHGGDVRIRGRSVGELSAKERAAAVAYVPQRPKFPPGMAVFDYVLLGRTSYMGPLAAESADDVAIVWEALSALKIEAFAGRNVATLSGGETQRVSLARVIAQRSSLLVLDEATASLDLSAQHEVLELIDSLREPHGITVVSAIHDLTAAAQFCDEVALLDEGRLRAFGGPAAVLTEEHLQDVLEASIRVIMVDGSPVIVALRNEESER